MSQNPYDAPRSAQPHGPRQLLRIAPQLLWLAFGLLIATQGVRLIGFAVDFAFETELGTPEPMKTLWELKVLIGTGTGMIAAGLLNVWFAWRTLRRPPPSSHSE